MITNHDLNEVTSLGTVHVYEVTFMSNDYRAIYEVEVGGNVSGLGLFETAAGRVYDALPERNDCRFPALVLFNDHGDSIIHEEGYSGERDTKGTGFLTELVTSVVLKEIRRKVPGMYPDEMPDPEPPRRLDHPDV